MTGVQTCALPILGGGDDPEDSGAFADGTVETYYADLLAWLASDTAHAGYCDDALLQFGAPPNDGLLTRVTLGRVWQLIQVFEAVQGRLLLHAEDVAA